MNPADNLSTYSIDLLEFKARYLEILEQLTPQGIVLTKEGRPVARITPLNPVINEALIGSMKDEISINGGIFSTGL